MHLEDDRIEIMIYNKADKVFQELLTHYFLDIKFSWKFH